jgi:hypothetical protein
MTAVIIRPNPMARCPCGAPHKAFDFRVEPELIVHDCRRCGARLLEIEITGLAVEQT